MLTGAAAKPYRSPGLWSRVYRVGARLNRAPARGDMVIDSTYQLTRWRA